MKKLILITLAVLCQFSNASADNNTGRSSKKFILVQPWLGEYYRTGNLFEENKNCPRSFEIFVKRDMAFDTLVGIHDTFDVGFDPKLEMINAAPYVSDAGGYHDRFTSFVINGNSFQITDKFTSFVNTLTITKQVTSSDSIAQEELVTISASGFLKGNKTNFQCKYTHFTYSRSR